MLGPVVLGFVLLVAVGLGSWLFRRRRGRSRSDAERRSRERHEAAQNREPPVDIGDVVDVGIHEFTDHHSGERRAVGKVEGFVVFVEDIPDDCEPTDVIRIKILSFNRGHTSATATYLETV
ncbi:TRAM domain-containing protein [Natrinema salifodinae]|uniref:Predicted RNA-binding protein, contains TRAM domain n=1 Tax=Natrinema salifodinae TaxID=1202768 RepID=A0A1I0NNM2_9EURY|nr:RNA-binding protein [Natrinema salifodinae]SEW03021.1 Predicted RNA-binding protein, contains TRAM domain [Natrinema salifodinae]